MSSQIQNILEQFGLSHYESIVYLELLKLGQSGAGPIIRRSGVHRQFVYSALARLVERGLAVEQLHNRQKLFHVVDPREIGRRETERFRQVHSILPELLALQPQGSKAFTIEVFSGSSEFFGAILSSTDSAARTDSIARIMGGGSGSEFYTILGSKYEEYVRYSQKKKVSKRLIASISSYKEYEERYRAEKRSELRIVRYGMTAPSYTRMTKEMVDIMVFGEEPLVIRIWNKTIAKAYIEHFELIWKVAEKLPLLEVKEKKKSRSRAVPSKRVGR